MNRKLAVAGSLSAAVAFVSGAVMVGTLLSAGPATHASPDLAAAGLDTGPSTVTSLDPVVVYQDEYEYVVTGGGVTPVGSAPGVAASDEVDGPAAGPQGTTAPAPAATAAPTVTIPAVTAGPAPVTTTTTRPPGVPPDWPPDKPIPPMPVGCRDGQLEDNGVWNCQH